MKLCNRILSFLICVAIIITSLPLAYAEAEHIHNYDSQVITEVSHYQNGVSRNTCSCGDWYDEVILSPGHSYNVDVLTEMTHDNDGLVRYSCSCGDWYDEIVLSPGHSYTSETLTATTHESNGLIRYTCSCGDWYDEIVFSTGHTYTEVVVEQVTHANNGLIRYICSCGDFYEVTILGENHNYQTIIIPPTCTDNGKELKRCKICGHEIILRDPDTDPSATDLLATDHNYKIINQVAPTQDTDGYTEYLCTGCGDTYTAIREHDDKYVAEMYICAKRVVSPMGHMWVYIQNKSDHDLLVGAYTVPAGQGVSIGVYGLTRADGMGIYYNVEAYSANKFGLTSVICMQEKLTEDELNKVSRRIRNSNFWDLIFFNCMGIAFSIWNSGATPKLIPLIFPVFGRLQIMMYPHMNEIDMYYPTVNQVYKQRGMGNNARLDKVSAGTLSNGI